MTINEKIVQAQKGLGGTDAYMVGEQLKDICRGSLLNGEIVSKDLDIQGMGLQDCAAKIKAYADKHRGKSSFVCVPPDVAEGIIREFYGLQAAAGKPEDGPEAEAGFLNLEDFL